MLDQRSDSESPDLRIEQKIPPLSDRIVTVTISLLGTRYHQRNPESQSILIALLKCVATGPTQAIYLINGVGGVAPTASDSYPLLKLYPDFVPEGDEFMLGQYTAKITFDPDTGKITTQKTLKPYKEQSGAIGGWLAASGAHDARLELIQLAHAILKTGVKQVVFNVVAFSRGADTAFRAANDIQAHFGIGSVKMNIVGIDPVYGPYRDAPEARIIPRSVRDSLIFLHEEEYRLGFEPLSDFVIEDRNQTRCRFHILNGEHCDSSRENSEDAEKNFPAQLAVTEIQKFLLRNGTRLSHTLPLVRLIKGEFETDYFRLLRKSSWTVKKIGRITESNKTPIDDPSVKLRESQDNIRQFCIYTRIAAHREARVDGWLTAKRGFTSRKAEYFLHGDDYFVNKQHQELFKTFFPKYFDYFFQRCAENSTYPAVLDELNAQLKSKVWSEVEIERDGEFGKVLALSLTKAGYFFPSHIHEEDKEAKTVSPPSRGVRLMAEFSMLEDKEQKPSELTLLMRSIISAARFAINFDDKRAVSIAEQLCATLQTILKEDPCMLTAEQFYNVCLAKFKIALADALIALKQVGYQDVLCYQIDEILSRTAHVKLVLECLKNPILAKSASARKLIANLVESMEEIFKSSELADEQKIKAVRNIMRVYVATPESLDITNMSELAKQAFVNHLKTYHLDVMDVTTAKNWLQGTRLQYLDFMIQELTRITVLPQFKKQAGIIQTFSLALINDITEKVKHDIDKHMLEQHASLLLSVINRAISAAAQFRENHDLKYDLDVETVLRKLQMGLSTFEMLPKTAHEERTIDMLLNAFADRLKDLLKKEETIKKMPEAEENKSDSDSSRQATAKVFAQM